MYNISRLGINVIGISSDGDPRLVSNMKTLTSFNLKLLITAATPKLYGLYEIYYFQDTIHIGTKLRNRLLNSSIVLYMGSKIVSTVHIKKLLKTVAKEVHGLVLSDICPDDRQNFESLEKLMDDRVLNAMKAQVADCEGTVMYLTLCKLITSSFLATNLMPIERIYRIWYSVFFLRCWRKWLKSNNNYSLKENFISDNAYTCIEINAHNLIQAIIKLRSNGQENLFLPHLFASQPCEHIFRMMRSMGTVNFTKINFSLNELIHSIAKVEIMQKIRFTCNDIEFPRFFKESSSDNITQLPSDNEIQKAVEEAQKNALEKAAQFGMILTSNDIASTEISINKTSPAESRLDDDDEDIYDSDDEEVEEIVEENAKENASDDMTLSPFLHFTDSDGTTRKVRKSTFIWMHSEHKDKLSSDRLKRVQGTSSSLVGPNSKRRKVTSSGVSAQLLGSEPNLVKSNEIMIGDWVLFDLQSARENDINSFALKNELAEQNGILIGLIIGFRCIDEKNKSKQHKVDFVCVMDQTPSENQNRKKILALAIWYSCNENGVLKQIIGNLSLGIESYKFTMKTPIIKSESDGVHYSLPFEYSELKNIHNVSN